MNLELTDKIGGRSSSSPLTLLGERQAAALGSHLRKSLAANGTAPTDLRYFASTAVRALDTARLMLTHMGVANPDNHVITSGLLQEQDMGDWEGGLRSECYTPENLEIIKADTHGFAAPGGESQLQVEERMIAFLQEHVLPAATPKSPAVVVGHGMAFKCVLRYVLGSDARMSRKIAIGNTAITEIGWVPEDGAQPGLQPGWHILRVNDMTHLNSHFDLTPI